MSLLIEKQNLIEQYIHRKNQIWEEITERQLKSITRFNTWPDFLEYIKKREPALMIQIKFIDEELEGLGYNDNIMW